MTQTVLTQFKFNDVFDYILKDGNFFKFIMERRVNFSKSK